LEPAADTHAHLDFQQYKNDRGQVIQRARRAGIHWIINPGASLVSSRRSVRLAQDHPGIYAGVGIHPHDAVELDPAALEELRALAGRPKVVAIGEIGLDYYRDRSPRDVQRRAFRQQLDLAKDLNLPVILHDRDAHADIMAILERWFAAGGRGRGIFHAFSGDIELAQRVLEMGFHIAIGGPVTFHNARRLAEVATHIPLERLLVETDCPYLTPHPHRGERNEPAFVRLVIARLAELKKVDVDYLARVTAGNARRLFDLPQEN